MLGTALMTLGRRLLEAASTPNSLPFWGLSDISSAWATIIHHSTYVGCPGVTLSELAAKSDQTQFTWLGFALIYERLMSPATKRRNRPYECVSTL
jgi:hypothetical protein